MQKSNIKNILVENRKYINPGGRILNSRVRKTVPDTVNLHWWSMERVDKKENVGDMLSIVVYDYMLKQKNIDPCTLVDSTKHLYGIGSIIQGGAQNAVIWGSGLKHGLSDLTPRMCRSRTLDVRLARGPETAKALKEAGIPCPEIYGDPAILMPIIYQPVVRKTGRPLVVLHFKSDLVIPNAITPVTDDWKNFIDQICAADFVISSSLHGIILAESYGVPAVLLKDSVTDEKFKYDDYYHSTGRNDYPVATSVEEAYSMPLPKVPDLSMLRSNILNTFPYDLWEEDRK